MVHSLLVQCHALQASFSYLYPLTRSSKGDQSRLIRQSTCMDSGFTMYSIVEAANEHTICQLQPCRPSDMAAEDSEQAQVLSVGHAFHEQEQSHT